MCGLCIVNTAVTPRDRWAAGQGDALDHLIRKLSSVHFVLNVFRVNKQIFVGNVVKSFSKLLYVEFLKGTLSLIVSRLCSGGKIQFRRINIRVRDSAARQQHCPGVPSWSDPKILRLIAWPRDKTPQKENYCSRPFLVLQNSEQMFSVPRLRTHDGDGAVNCLLSTLVQLTM